jgi:rhamnulokinase
VTLESLLGEAAALPRPTDLFDADDPRFLAPGDLPGRIAEWYAERGLRAPASPAGVVRAIIESLADAFARAVRTASALSGVTVDTVHIVGGGARNALLCQATADRLGVPVLAGPVEATAIGNALVQARAAGLLSGDLETLRGLVGRVFAPLRYEPARVGV